MDIDLDFADRDAVLAHFQHVAAAIKDPFVGFRKHLTGVYVQNIPHNPIDNVSTIDYKEANDRGYFKLDFLNLGVYRDIRDQQHLLELMNTEPVWELLEHKEFASSLFHVGAHTDVLQLMKPKSIEQLAAVLAMIRPGKKHLIGQDWNTVFAEIWNNTGNDNKYFFKKSHSISYAVVVVVHMNLICEKIAQLDSTD